MSSTRTYVRKRNVNNWTNRTPQPSLTTRLTEAILNSLLSDAVDNFQETLQLNAKSEQHQSLLPPSSSPHHHHHSLTNLQNTTTTTTTTTTFRPFYKSINIHAYKNSGGGDGTGGGGGGNYYLAGVLFMVSVIGLLLYVNLYYEYCFRDTCFRLAKFRACFFLRYFFVSTNSRSTAAVVVGSSSSSSKKTTSANRKEKEALKEANTGNKTNNDRRKKGEGVEEVVENRGTGMVAVNLPEVEKNEKIDKMLKKERATTNEDEMKFRIYI